jgi:nucleoside-diphosphate-sugar epimerase
MRLHLLKDWAQLYFSVRAEDGSMVKWIETHRPQIWIHHHHFMTDFRSPQYDLDRANQVAIKPLPALIKALAASDCRGLIFSGSYFEPGEGGQINEQQVTPYGRNKAQTWHELARECATHELYLSKVVIPNPVGPFENEDRLTPVMLRKATHHELLDVRSPNSVSDNIPASSLAQTYLQVAEDLFAQGLASIVRPSGWIMTVREWVELINGQLLVASLGRAPCEVQWGSNEAPKTEYRNRDVIAEMPSPNAFCTDYAKWLTPTQP